MSSHPVDAPRENGRTDEWCPACGESVAVALQGQHAEWHRRMNDALYGGCPA